MLQKIKNKNTCWEHFTVQQVTASWLNMKVDSSTGSVGLCWVFRLVARPPRPTQRFKQILLGSITRATHVRCGVCRFISLVHYIHSRWSPDTLLLDLTGRQKCRQKKKHSARPEIKRARAALGKRRSGEETHLACSEHGAPTVDRTQHPADARAHKAIRQHATRRYNIDSPSDRIHALRWVCAYRAEETHKTHKTHIIVPPSSTRHTDEPTNRDKQINKQQIHIMAATQTAGHPLPLFLWGKQK